jgi:hypothetical protein
MDRTASIRASWGFRGCECHLLGTSRIDSAGSAESKGKWTDCKQMTGRALNN